MSRPAADVAGPLRVPLGRGTGSYALPDLWWERVVATTDRLEDGVMRDMMENAAQVEAGHRRTRTGVAGLATVVALAVAMFTAFVGPAGAQDEENLSGGPA